MQQIAPPHTYEQVVHAEVAHELLNTAGSIIMSRIYEIEDIDPDAVERFRLKHQEIMKIKRSFDVTDDVIITNIIGTWKEKLKDHENFLSEL
jgi:hypothetical protein